MKTLDTIEKPLAIAMWDSSWLRRRYRGGGFEDWDKVLSDLTLRGYNAVRIDAFPHLIAKDPEGRQVDVFKDIPDHSPNFYGFGMWGTQWTNYINPRAALPEFVIKCREHGVKVALSTWFKPTADNRNEIFEGAESVIRVWDETLRLLNDNACLDNVIYLDILNEFPSGFCMQWFHDALRARRFPKPPDGETLNARQKEFARSFLTESVKGLKKLWPSISIATSLTLTELDVDVDMSVMDFIDCHMWVCFDKELTDGTGYWDTIAKHGHPDYHVKREQIPGSDYAAPRYRLIPHDINYDEINAKLLDSWSKKKSRVLQKLKSEIEKIAALGKKFDIPVGNTEGYGMVLWAEHPLLTWDITRESAAFATKIGAENNYLFNCSANFCHPHHIGFWEDIEWHKVITNTIKSDAR